MKRLRDSSLALQLPLFAAGCSLLVACCLLCLAATSTDYLQRQQEASYGQALAEQIAASLGEPLQRGDLLSARANLQRFVDGSLAAGIAITDVMGLPMGEAGVVDAPGQNRYSAPIPVGGDIAGEVRVALEPGLAGERQRLLLSLFALAFALSLLVFALSRFLAQRMVASLEAIRSQVALADAPLPESGNELQRLESTVEHLPLDMLRGHAAVPAPAREFRDAALLYVHLTSLTRYVDRLNETNLHRYTRRLQQLLHAAAQCYRGELQVTRPFGVLITFAPQRGAGSEALRAASCARLIATLARSLAQRTSLSLDMAMALGSCELGPDDCDDMYPGLYLQGTLDELRDACLRATQFPSVVIRESLLADSQLAAVANVEFTSADDDAGELKSLATEQETLVSHQAQLIVERIKPTRAA